MGSILLRTFMFVCTSPASRLLPCCSLSASRSWCLGQQRGELTRAHGPWTLTCRVKLLSCAQQHPERFTGKQVNVHKQRQGRWLSADVSVFLPSAECYSKLRAASVVRQRELYWGSLAVLLQTLILLSSMEISVTGSFYLAWLLSSLSMWSSLVSFFHAFTVQACEKSVGV